MSSSFVFATSLALLLPLGLGSVSLNADEPGADTALNARTIATSSGAPPIGVGAPQCTVQNLDPKIEPSSHSEPPKPALQSPVPSEVSASNPLEALYKSQTARQVRIERRVTIRISPYRQSNRNSLLAQLPREGVPTTFEERKMADCVPVSGIAGVQTGNGNRLLLFLNDQRIVSLNLERSCRARDFYSGFYIERNEDGRLCVKRDQLQSRSGAKCEVTGMRRLVAVGE